MERATFYLLLKGTNIDVMQWPFWLGGWMRCGSGQTGSLLSVWPDSVVYNCYVPYGSLLKVQSKFQPIGELYPISVAGRPITGVKWSELFNFVIYVFVIQPCPFTTLSCGPHVKPGSARENLFSQSKQHFFNRDFSILQVVCCMRASSFRTELWPLTSIPPILKV